MHGKLGNLNNPSVLFMFKGPPYTLQPGAPSCRSENAYTQGMPLTASHAPLLTLHMLWVDLSKCFMTFSRAVGQLLQARRGVPAQVR